MKKSRSTRSHFTHARSCSRALNQVPTRAKQPASIRKYSLWKGDIFSFDRFTGYTKSNQNRFGRVLLFAFALRCYKIYLFFPSLSDFGSFSWRVHLSYGVCRLRARVQLGPGPLVREYIRAWFACVTWVVAAVAFRRRYYCILLPCRAKFTG